MQSDVLNEQQQPLSNDIDCSSALTSNTATTLIYSGLKLHPKPLVPTISMPGVASPLSIVKKLSIPDAHLDSSTSNVRHASSTGSTATTTPSAIRLVAPTGKSSPPTNLQFQLAEKSSTNGGFSTAKTYFLNPQQSSTATVTKPQILPSTTSTPSLVTLIPPGTTSPKIQTLNSVTISSTNDLTTNAVDKSASTNSNQPVFLSKNRVTLVQPLITTANSASMVAATATNAANSLAPKLVIQQNATPVNATSSFWQQPQTAQATKIFSIPPSSILPTAKMLSRPVQLIPTSLSSAEHHHHHPHITHVQTVKSEKADSYPISMHFGLSSPTTENSLTPLNVQVQHPHAFATKAVDSAGHQTYFHMQLLPSTANSDALTAVPQPVQFTLPATHLYSSSSSAPTSSVLISTTQRSMDHNNNHQSTTTTITTPIIREMQTDEKLYDSAIVKTLHHNKVSSKNRPRLPLQPSTQQTAPTSATLLPSSSSSSSSSSPSTVIRQPKKHKLVDDDHSSSVEPPSKMPHYEQLDSSSNIKKLSNSRNRPLSKFSTENTTPNSSGTVDTSALAKKRPPTNMANASLAARKRRAISKPTSEPPSNENIKQESAATNINIEQIDDELLRRLSQDFVYVDKQSGLRWIGTKSRPKAMSSLVSRFSWKPKINHYEKYSDIIRTNPKRTVPVKTTETIRKSLSEPWASWRIDRLTTYLAELNHDEQTTQNQLSDILQSLQIDDQSVRTAVEDLFEANFQRHRCFCEQLTQISSVLVNILDHGNNLREICAVSKPSTSKRTKER